MTQKNVILLFVSLIIGALLVVQIKSFTSYNQILIRDTQSNIFQEIKILKDKNESLKKEISDLESTLDLLSDQTLALEAIEQEIDKYRKLNGKDSIFGPGLTITINGDITTPWIVDLINDFFNAGAQAVSVNDIRITNRSAGFDTLPLGQIFLNGSIISQPFEFDIIGESAVILEILESPGGIFQRMETVFPDITILFMEKDYIQMD